MNKKIAISMWNWVLWPAPEPIPETILDPVALVAMVAKGLKSEPEAEQDYIATNGTREALHATCEDYRAGASIDLEHDAADSGSPIDLPLLVVWGKTSASTGTIFDVEKAWAGEARNVTFKRLDCGHFLPEEKPAETASMLIDFFTKGA